MADVPTRDSKPVKTVVTPLIASGQIVAGYEVQRLVGKGGMGEVYQARQMSMDREVALKILSPKLALKDPSFAQRFVEEARAAGKLNHPNLIHVHDVGTAELPDGRGQVHYFSMEFIDGESVQDVLDREGVLPAPLLATVMTGVAEALAFAAKVGIVHRDIKPDNIMITKGGLVKVADLGLAIPSQTGDDHAPERDEKGRAKVMGTPLYLSPEQARAQPVDHRSDQYSLGATLFHCLTGDAPYRGPDAKSIMKSHVVDAIPDPRERREDLDEAWCQLCERLMSKRADERFASPKELVEAVEAAAKGVSLAQLERRRQGFVLPPQIKLYGLMALGVVVVGVAFWALLSQGHGHVTPPPAPPVEPAPPAAPAAEKPKTEAPVANKPVDPLVAFDAALASKQLAQAKTLLAACDQTKPDVIAAGVRLTAARTEQRKQLGVRIAAATTADLDALTTEVAAQALIDEDQAWLNSAIAARRKELAPPPAKPTPGDPERWRDLVRVLDRKRANLAYGEVKQAVDDAVAGFTPATAATVKVLGDLGPLAQNGEGALRAFVGAAQPHATVVIGGKDTDVLLNRLTRTEVFYVVQQNGAPGPEQKAVRTAIGMPWAQLLDEALKDQGVENAPLVKASTLWMWNLGEAKAAFAALGTAPLAQAVAELEKHRK
jgi:serine/threonine protein kinase